MSSKPTSVIVGAGEIGRALCEVLETGGLYRVFLFDVLSDEKGRFMSIGQVDFLHIAFPYTPHVFESEVERYQAMFKPTYTVVHSTVPVGTCSHLRVIHSPVRGKHYDMVKSIRTYTKFFGGLNADKAADHFLRIGVPVAVYQDSRATEFGKILETSYLGLNIRWVQEVEYVCTRAGLSFTEVWDKFVTTYNERCEDLHQPKFPAMVPIQGTIGGHCVMPNLEFLPDNFQFKPLLKGVEHE